MTTIGDVAKKAGVSPITVSRVINDHKYVSAKTRLKVEAAIAELQYVPNAAASSLASGRTHTIGLLLTDVTNPFFTAVTRGVEDVARGFGYSLILCNTDESVEQEKRYLELFLAKRVEGVIIPLCSSDVTHLRHLLDFHMPFVLIDNEVPEFDTDVVLVDSYGGAYQLVTHLIGLGHERIALINGITTVSSGRDRFLGYQQALLDNGLKTDPALVKERDYTQEHGYRAALELLAMPRQPSAIFATTVFLAVGALRALRERGVRVPHNIAVVSFGDAGIDALIQPFLTAVVHPAYQVGSIAAQFLFDRITGKAVSGGRRIVLPAHLVVRQSCGSQKSSGANPVAPLRACPSCGRAAQADWRNCPYCGAALM